MKMTVPPFNERVHVAYGTDDVALKKNLLVREIAAMNP
jgi:hypothetical protein